MSAESSLSNGSRRPIQVQHLEFVLAADDIDLNCAQNRHAGAHLVSNPADALQK